MMKRWDLLLAAGLFCSSGRFGLADPSALPPAMRETRLAVTLEQAGRPLAEVLPKLAAGTSLHLTVDKVLDDEKVTVYFTALRFDRAAESVAAAVDGVWREARDRDGKPEYRLEPSKRRSARLEEVKAQWRTATESRDRSVAARLDALLSGTLRSSGKEPSAPAPLMMKPEPIYPLMRSLPPGALLQVIRDANESFPEVNGEGPNSTPGLVLLGRYLSADQKRTVSVFLEKLAQESEAMPEFGADPQLFQTRAANVERLRVELWAQKSVGDSGLGVEFFLTLGLSESGWHQDYLLSPSPRTPTPDILDDLAALKAAAARLDDPREELPVRNLPSARARQDWALIEIARAARVNLAADYYTKPGAIQLPARALKLKDLLRETGRLAKQEHFWLGDTLVCRSRDWAMASQREPTAAVVDRWQHKRAEHAALELEDYLTACRLSDAQIAGLFNVADEHGATQFRTECRRLARNARPLRGYDGLSSLQRKQAARPEGLPLGRLSPAQQRQWSAALRPYALLPTGVVQALRLKALPTGPANTGPPAFLLSGLPDSPDIPLTVERR